MAERNDAGVAQHQIEGQREQRADGDLVEQQRAAREQEGDGEGGDPQRDLRPAPAHTLGEPGHGLVGFAEVTAAAEFSGRTCSRRRCSDVVTFRPAAEQALRPEDQHEHHDGVDDEAADLDLCRRWSGL